jgi:putative transposase
MTIAKAKDLDEVLVFLPPYSLDLNPIEFIWKSIKRVISAIFIVSVEHLKTTIREAFIRRSRSLSYAEKWVNTSLGEGAKSLFI